MNNDVELTYEESAAIVGVSPRAVRDVFRRYADLITPIEYGYNRVRFALSEVLAVKKQRRADAIQSAKKGKRK